jgi:acetyl-CoA C-acetyltransferase
MTAEAIVDRFGISRADQDGFAAESQRRALQAIESGAFKDEIVPVEVPAGKGAALRRVDQDEYPRAGTTVEKLAALKPAFKNDGTVTAGNASGINDGAAALVVANNERVSKTGEPVLACVLSYASTGIDPAIMGMGPVEAARSSPAPDDDCVDRSVRVERTFASQALA